MQFAEQKVILMWRRMNSSPFSVAIIRKSLVKMYKGNLPITWLPVMSVPTRKHLCHE